MLKRVKQPLLGVNLTARSQINDVRKLIESGAADYVEILIDNFISCDPNTIRDALGSIPIAFHIMNSRFLERDQTQLRSVAARFRYFIEIVQPIYVSDHLAQFSVDGLLLPSMKEMDYVHCFDVAKERVAFWQELLGSQLLLENFASVMPERGSGQPEFFQSLINQTGCGILFDVSNAVLARRNAQVEYDRWNAIVQLASHFHAGGFSRLQDSTIWIDSHDHVLDKETKQSIAEIFESCSGEKTLTIEFDHEIDYAAWEHDLTEVRATLSSLV